MAGVAVLNTPITVSPGGKKFPRVAHDFGFGEGRQFHSLEGSSAENKDCA